MAPQSPGHLISPGTQSPWALNLPGHLVSQAMSLLGTQSLGTQFLGTKCPGQLVATTKEVMAYGLAPTVVEAYSHFFAGRMQSKQSRILFFKDIKDIKDKDTKGIRMRIHHFHVSLSLSFEDIQRFKQRILTQTIFINILHGLSPIKSELLQL